MKTTLDMDAIFAPIPGENPSGEDLRYTRVYDEIREARRADELIPQGEWERETKTADWKKVITLSLESLTGKSKDLQIAAWLTEALTATDGFEGTEAGMRIMTGLLENFWDTVYPLVEDEDYDYRVAPFDFLNSQVTAAAKQVPLTDPKTSKGYPWLKWKESRDVGYEKDARGDQRNEKISEGKIPAEEFDTSVAKSSAAFYKALVDSLTTACETFKAMEALSDGKFGPHAPRVTDLGETLEECHRIIVKICREQKGLKDVVGGAAGENEAGGGATGSGEEASGESTDNYSSSASGAAMTFQIPTGSDDSNESQIWRQALATMQSGSFRDALNLLLAASSSQPSERGRCRYRFLVAKLCLKAGHPELALPILEQLNTLITEHHLEHWESPYWVSEIYEALYQCLTTDDPGRAQELFKKICTMDVTKALAS